jgi:hypothetical protein
MSFVFRAVALCLAIMAAPSLAADSDPVMELAWGKLVPPAPPPSGQQAMKAKSFLSGATPFKGAGGSEPPPPPTVDDKRWLSERRMQPGAGAATAVVAELDGKRVRIGGYVVPLDFEATRVKEFLLVPFVGACIHVPPPPANQIIHVMPDKPVKGVKNMEAVWVSGRLGIGHSESPMGKSGYQMQAKEVVRYKER